MTSEFFLIVREIPLSAMSQISETLVPKSKKLAILDLPKVYSYYSKKLHEKRDNKHPCK